MLKKDDEMQKKRLLFYISERRKLARIATIYILKLQPFTSLNCHIHLVETIKGKSQNNRDG